MVMAAAIGSGAAFVGVDASASGPDGSQVVDRHRVTADALPTVQINGVVWALQTVGNTVFVGGEFTSARPAGAPAGTDEVARRNFLAFDLTTGELIDGIDPQFNAKVNDMDVSADGKTLYVGGSFSQVDGLNRYRLAAIDVATGEVATWFAPGFDATVNSVDVDGDVVYVGGAFSKLGSRARSRLAAVNARNGGTLDWAPTVDGLVQGVAVTPDRSRVVLSGNFTTINDETNRGIGAVTTDTFQTLPFPANEVIWNYGSGASNYDLKMQDDGTVYTTGFLNGTSSLHAYEGVVSINSYTGELNWIADCHGDSYDTARVADVVYVVSHHHNCENIGGYPDTNPRTRYQNSDAFTVEATGTVRTNVQSGYRDFGGQPAPSLVQWFPSATPGTYTGQGQAGWTLDATDEYLVMGGEFLGINGTDQQGLVRFAVVGSSPNIEGPRNPDTVPTGAPISDSTMRISWTGNWDRDDHVLSYELQREDLQTPVCTTTAPGTFWYLSPVSCKDRDVTLGQTYRYRVVASDPWGNLMRGPWTEITMPADVDAYQAAVLNSEPAYFWRMETIGLISDEVGNSALTTYGTMTVDDNGIMGTSKAVKFSAIRATAGTVSTTQAPNVFTTEAWFRTTSRYGGKIIGFGNRQSGNSSSYDRHVYLTNNGSVVFGVYPDSTVKTVSSGSGYNDGQWHHVMATLSEEGMSLYLDGKRVASRADATAGQQLTGYWRVGGDKLAGWPSAPWRTSLSGSIDEVAVYSKALTAADARNHYEATGRVADLPAPPTDDYGAAVAADGPVLQWRLDETTGTRAADAGIGLRHGTIVGSPRIGVTSEVHGSSIILDGSGQYVRSNEPVITPAEYSHEVWINTDATGPARIIGWGSSATGASSTYDREVALNETGQLVFTSNNAAITSPDAVNDGAWHHVVATQGAQGMALYVDGVLVGTHQATPGPGFIGYLRVGGDGSTVTGTGYLAGAVDEVATYASVLSTEQVRAHYRASELFHNHPPAGRISARCDGAGVCSLSANATDRDGSIVDVVWDFGDTTSGGGNEVVHAYQVNDTYHVSAVITDDLGDTTVVSADVPVTIFEPPVAMFTATCQYRVCTFDASASVDPDGDILEYRWEFGDGESATGVTTTHTYSEAGTHAVTLTVVDSQGRDATNVQNIDVVDNQAPVAEVRHTSDQLTVSFDASGSHDPDGGPVELAWDFGDGSVGTGLTTAHSYAQRGVYVVRLTVTDEVGASTTTVAEVVADDEPAGQLVALDTFSRTGQGWAAPEVGGTGWTATSSLATASTDGTGVSVLEAATGSNTMRVDGLFVQDVRVAASFKLDTEPTGSGVQNSLIARQINNGSDYRFTVYVGADHRLRANLSARNNWSTTNLGDMLLSDVNWAPGDVIDVALEVTGSGTSTLSGYVWRHGDLRPTIPVMTRTDSTPSLQVAGRTGVANYAMRTVTVVPVIVRWDDFEVREIR